MSFFSTVFNMMPRINETIEMMEHILMLLENDDVEEAKSVLRVGILKRKRCVDSMNKQKRMSTIGPTTLTNSPPSPSKRVSMISPQLSTTKSHANTISQNEYTEDESTSPVAPSRVRAKAFSQRPQTKNSFSITSIEKEEATTRKSLQTNSFLIRKTESIPETVKVLEENDTPPTKLKTVHQIRPKSTFVRSTRHLSQHIIADDVLKQGEIVTPQKSLETTLVTPEPEPKLKPEIESELVHEKQPSSSSHIQALEFRSEKQQAKYDMVVAEILQTERDYVRDLQIILDVCSLVILMNYFFFFVDFDFLF